jgi:hypothetical protein
MKPMLTLINPVARAEPFDHADWVFEAKFDGFRVAADTVRGRLISRNGNRVQRFEEVLDLLPKGHVFDGELVVLDRPRLAAIIRMAAGAPRDSRHSAGASSALGSLGGVLLQPLGTRSAHVMTLRIVGIGQGVFEPPPTGASLGA